MMEQQSLGLEIVTNGAGIARQCYVLNRHGQRLSSLPIKNIAERRASAEEPATVTVELHDVHVKWGRA